MGVRWPPWPPPPQQDPPLRCRGTQHTLKPKHGCAQHTNTTPVPVGHTSRIPISPCHPSLLNPTQMGHPKHLQRYPQIGVHQIPTHLMDHICKVTPRYHFGHHLQKEGPRDRPMDVYPHENPTGGMYVDSQHQCTNTPQTTSVHNPTFTLLDNYM